MKGISPLPSRAGCQTNSAGKVIPHRRVEFVIVRANIQTGYYSSFVVKIWVEDEKVVRGRIQHVGTRESVYFSDFDKMLEFIMNHRNTPPKNSLPSDEPIDSSLKSQLPLELWGD